MWMWPSMKPGVTTKRRGLDASRFARDVAVERLALADRHDPVAADRQGAVLDDLTLRVHRHDRGAGDQKIGCDRPVGQRRSFDEQTSQPTGGQPKR